MMVEGDLFEINFNVCSYFYNYRAENPSSGSVAQLTLEPCLLSCFSTFPGLLPVVNISWIPSGKTVLP